MRALIVRGLDRHTLRLQAGLKSCGILSRTVTNYEELTPHKYDLAFIDPSFKYDISAKINAERIFFYDCEDGPRDFFPDVAYYTMKDKVLAYAKMNYYEDDRNDGIKNIGFPLSTYMNLGPISNHSFTFNQLPKPFFVGCPTYIGDYAPIESGAYANTSDIYCLAKHESGNIMYNQRYDWLLSLMHHGINYEGGIVFQEGNNLSVEFQSKYFGNVARLRARPMPYNDQLLGLIKNKIGLCPAGHERISWRTYDIMATGSILIRTDHKKQLALINPKEYITIYDGEDLGDKLASLQPRYEELHKLHQANREIFKTLTPQKLMTLFLDQLD